MSFVFKSTTLNAANIIYRFGRFKQYDNKWFKKITKLSKIIRKGHKYNARQYRFATKPRGKIGWVKYSPDPHYTINYLARCSHASRCYTNTIFSGTHWLDHRVHDCFNRRHCNIFIKHKGNYTKKDIIDMLEMNNIKYKKSWAKTKLFKLLYSF
tara:strand:- start:181 stop:642 length:462 start_codon:yes stop_codon:yes gene_type:complete